MSHNARPGLETTSLSCGSRADFTRAADLPLFVVRQHAEELARPCKRAATHEHMVLAFCTGGSLRMEQGGEWSITEGDVSLIPAGAPHRILETNGSERWILSASPSRFAADGNQELLDPFDRVRAGGAAVVGIPETRRTYLTNLFTALELEIARPERGALEAQRSLVTLILTEVARAASQVAAVGAPPGGVVSDALSFIGRHCLEPISLKDVADAVHRSPAHVTTLVRRATGLPVQAWIIAGRLAEARRRLLHTDELVEVIAERVGYSDATHFIRLFRRAHGVTPVAWRAREVLARALPA